MIRRIRDYFRALLSAVTRVADAVQGLSTVAYSESRDSGETSAELADIARRLDAIERDRARWEAEVEAMVIKAEARFKAARASEERARHLSRGKDEEEEEDDFAGEDAGRGREEGMPAVHPALAMDTPQPNQGRPLSKRERARQLKYSRL